MKRYEDTTVNVLAREVANIFGGQHVKLEHGGGFYECFARVDVPAFEGVPGYELNLRLSNFGADKGRISVTLYPTLTHKDVTTHSAGEITVNSARGAQAICADISKRLVNKPEVLEKLRENAKRVEEAKAREAGVLAHVEALKAACPNVMTYDHRPPSGGSIEIYGKDGAYLNGRVYSDGSVGFDRLGNVSLDQAKRILAILAEGH